MVQPSMALSEIEIRRARFMDEAAHARLMHQARTVVEVGGCMCRGAS